MVKSKLMWSKDNNRDDWVDVDLAKFTKSNLGSLRRTWNPRVGDDLPDGTIVWYVHDRQKFQIALVEVIQPQSDKKSGGGYSGSNFLGRPGGDSG